MTKRPRIGVVGSSNVDLVTYVERMPVWGETISAPRFEMSHGGKGNQAVAAAKLGASVVMVSKVGDDMLGEGVLKNFEAAGVNAAHVQRVPGQSTGTATILVNVGGDNFILIVKGANGDLNPADVEAAGGDLKGCDLILLQLEVPLETVYAALAFGKRHGVKTALNPAPAVRNLDMDKSGSRASSRRTRRNSPFSPACRSDRRTKSAAAAKSLLAQGVETVIVTLGARGSLLATAQGLKRIAPARVQAVDSPAPATPSSARSPAISPPVSARGGARPGDPLCRRIRSRSAARRSPSPRRPSSRVYAGRASREPGRWRGASRGRRARSGSNSLAVLRSGGCGDGAQQERPAILVSIPWCAWPDQGMNSDFGRRNSAPAAWTKAQNLRPRDGSARW